MREENRRGKELRRGVAYRTRAGRSKILGVGSHWIVNDIDTPPAQPAYRSTKMRLE
jgi:hypothetical protein